MQLPIRLSNEKSVTTQWTIKNFPYLLLSAHERDYILHSNVFRAGVDHKSTWYLQLVIHSDKSHDKGYVGLFICLKTVKGQDKRRLFATQEYSIINSVGQQILLCHVKHPFGSDVESLGNPRLIRKSFLMNTKTLMPNNSLTISCKHQVQLCYDEFPRELNPTGERRMLGCYRMMMLSDNTPTDVKFLFDDGVVEAHRHILSQASVVFEAMFIRDPKGNSRCVVKVDNVSMEIFILMLRYIYTRMYPDEKEYVYELLEAAHEYRVTRLIRCCSKFLLTILTFKNAAKIFLLAYYHDNQILMMPTVEFIIECIKYVAQTDGYKEMEREHIQALAKLGEALAVYGKN